MLQNGPPFLMIPGPTTLPAEVLRAMHRPAVEIYDGPILEVTRSCLEDLKRVFRTEAGQVYIYVGNGHAAWDGALANVLTTGETALVLESGHFAREWGLAAAALGITVESLPGSWTAAVDPEAIRKRLAADTDHTIKAVMMVQVDTASSVVNDVPAVRRAMDDAEHPALLMVDTVASLGCMPFEMDAWGVDLAMSASQKGLMSPAGLAFVAAGPKAHAMAERANLRSRYLDWGMRRGEAHYLKYGGTPPEQLMYGLRAALDMILGEGLEQVWNRHAVLAEAVRRAATEWAKGGAIGFGIAQPEQRSNSITVLTFADGKGDALRRFLSSTLAVTVSATIGEMTGRGIRIGHMGHINGPAILGTIAAMETGLLVLGIPAGSGGCEAAIRYLAGALAEVAT